MPQQPTPVFGQMNRQQRRALSKQDQLRAIDHVGGVTEKLQKKIQDVDQDVDVLLSLLVRTKLSGTDKLQKDDSVICGIFGRLFLEDGTLAENPFNGGVANEMVIKALDNGELIPGMESQMVGHSPGEQFEVEVTFPADYHQTNLQNKKASFLTVIHAAFRPLPSQLVIPQKQQALVEKMLAELKKKDEEKKANEAASQDQSGQDSQ